MDDTEETGTSGPQTTSMVSSRFSDYVFVFNIKATHEPTKPRTESVNHHIQ